MKASVYKRPAKPMRIDVKARDRFAGPSVTVPEVVTVDRATECHVTPPDVAARMVNYLGPVGDYLTLEPSAGTGALVRALLESGHSQSELTMVERHNSLAAGLHRFGPVINRCFLEWSAEVAGKVAFPRVIMNPPFRQVRQHVKAALQLLDRGGHDEPAVLVALVPITFEHTEAETIETLPDTTFSAARVNTKIIRIRR